MDCHSPTVLSLCSGAGGLELGLKLAMPRARTICYVEGEAYVAAILAARMEDKTMDAAPVWSNVKTFDAKPWRGCVDIITAGYPCQPFSIAGAKRAEKDPRHLWPYIREIVRTIEPSICFFENVSHHLRLGFEQVHDDLRSMGYSVAAGLFTAEEVGAPHKRERLFILAHRESHRSDGRLSQLPEIQREARCGDAFEPARSSETYVADGENFLFQWSLAKRNQSGQPKTALRKQRSNVADGDSDGFICEQSAPTGKNDPQGREKCSAHTFASRNSDAVEGLPLHKTRSASTKIGQELQDSESELANSAKSGLERHTEHEAQKDGADLSFGNSLQLWPPSPGDTQSWGSVPDALKPAIHRMADGMAYRVDRIRACGNGVVPLVAAYAFRILITAIDRKP